MSIAIARFALACGAALVLAACSDAEPEQVPFAEPGVSFAVVQVGAECGANGAYRADVVWQVPESMPPKVEVQVSQERRQIFARSNERVGSARTELWVHPGLEFYLMNRENGNLLAALEAGPGECAPQPTP